MYNKLAAELDKIAESLESKGLLKEATELDIVANTMERLAYTQAGDGLFKGDWQTIKTNVDKNIMANKLGGPINVNNIVTLLDKLIKMRFQPFVDNYSKFISGTKLEQLVSGSEGALEVIKASEKKPELLLQVKDDLSKIEKFWKGLEGEITQAEMQSRTNR